MGRPCCDKHGIKKGPWTPEEDIILVSFIQEHGPGNWRSVPTNTGKFRHLDPFDCSSSYLRWVPVIGFEILALGLHFQCLSRLGVFIFGWLNKHWIMVYTNGSIHLVTCKGLLRCSKSCRLRWTNYLRPGIKRGNFTPHEEGMIIHLQALLGNK